MFRDKAKEFIAALEAAPRQGESDAHQAHRAGRLFVALGVEDRKEKVRAEGRKTLLQVAAHPEHPVGPWQLFHKASRARKRWWMGSI